MSLQTRLDALITAIGADIKALQAASPGTKDVHNGSTTQQILTNGITYLAGSACAIPQGKIQVGTKYRCRFSVSKTAAGSAAPDIHVKVGTAGTTADTSRATITMALQTAVADNGFVDVEVIFRVAGASAVLQSLAIIDHRLAATGLSTSNTDSQTIVSAAFDATPANLKIGVAVNVGASSNWTLQLVSAELMNLAP